MLSWGDRVPGDIDHIGRQGLSLRKISERVKWFPANDGPARNPSPAIVHRYLKELQGKESADTSAPPTAEPRSESDAGRSETRAPGGEEE